LIATKTFGNGKVLFMGTDGAWRWRKGVEDKYHYRFWGQVVRWMSYQRTMASGESMRIFHSPDRPHEGEMVVVQANVMNRGGEPLQSGVVTLKITSPQGEIETITLRRDDPDAWGVFRGQFRPKLGGDYELAAACSETGDVLETRLHVQGLDREQIGRPARFDVLRDLAMATQGEFVTLDQIDQVLSKSRPKQDVAPIETRMPLWSHPYWAIGILCGLTLFWAGRKGIGLL
jgi:hypothetical protein